MTMSPPSSHFFSCKKHLWLVLLFILFHLCFSEQKYNDALCIDGERNALMEFKNGLIDKADRLASWVGEKSDCCRWAGIVCDNNTGHVHGIHLRGLDGHCDAVYRASYGVKNTYGLLRQRLRGYLSPSLLELKQLKHLDLSCNNFEVIRIPSFIGSLGNLRYLNLSESRFSGVIPPQIGNLSELRVLSLGSSYAVYQQMMSTPSLLWLSNLRRLNHLDMSYIDLSEAIDWFQVINTLPSLVQLHLSMCQLKNLHPYVAKLNNLTTLSVLDISANANFLDKRIMPQWIFSLTSLVSLDLTSCRFASLVPNSIYSFYNLTSLESLHVQYNEFMNSPSILKGLPRNLISLNIGSCGVSSSSLTSLHNLTSLLSIDMSRNQLTKPIPNSLCNFCNLRELDLSENNFANIDLTSLLNSLFNCKSPNLESLLIYSSGLSGPVPYSIGRFSSLKKLHLHQNRLNDSLPDSIGRLSSLEKLLLSKNQLSGSLPDSLGQLAKLEDLWIYENFLMGIVTEVHFSKLVRLKSLDGLGNNLILKVARNWIPPFLIQSLRLNSWRLGPEFPLWLKSQTDLEALDISNTHISSLMPPESFWRSLSNLKYLDMTQNYIKGTLTLDSLAKLDALYLGSNELSGNLPSLYGSSLVPLRLDLSNNSFTGSLHGLLCSKGVEETRSLDLGFDVLIGIEEKRSLYLGNNRLSGVIPECLEKWRSLSILNLENNDLSGEIPRTLSSLNSLKLLNIQGNKISGRISTALVNLTNLQILQLGRNELVGSIPSWLGTRLTLLRILNLRSNKLEGNIPRSICYLLHIQILDISHNSLFGNIPRCFNNFRVFSGNESGTQGYFFIFDLERNNRSPFASDTLVTKGQEYFYKSLLVQLRLMDLASNNFSGSIPSELTDLHELQSLNLSRNQLIGKIPEKIGDMKMLESLDLSLNKISGNLPMSMSRLTFLSNFNISYNNLTGRIPGSTQLQSFKESSFVGNKLCGAPLSDQCLPVEAPSHTTGDQKEDNGSDWGLVISIILGLGFGFWIIMVPLILSRTWRIAYFRLVHKLVRVI